MSFFRGVHGYGSTHEPTHPTQPNSTLIFIKFNYVWIQPEPTHLNPLIFGSVDEFEVLNTRTREPSSLICHTIFIFIYF